MMGNWPSDSGTWGQWPQQELLCGVGARREGWGRRLGWGSHQCQRVPQARDTQRLCTEVDYNLPSWGHRHVPLVRKSWKATLEAGNALSGTGEGGISQRTLTEFSGEIHTR